MGKEIQRNIVITGATTGIGLQVALTLVSGGHNVCILARTQLPSTEPALTRLKHEAKTSGAVVELIDCDLSSFASVRKAATALLDEDRKWPNGIRRIHALVNNAGIFKPHQRTESKDGYEQHLQIMWLSHVLLTELLVPLLKVKPPLGSISGGSRVIFISATYHRKSKIKLENTFTDPNNGSFYDLNHKNDGKWSASLANNDSKFAITASVSQLAERYKNQISFHSVHPGAYFTSLQSEIPFWQRVLLKTLLRPGFSNIRASGKLIAQFVLAPQWGKQTGLYFEADVNPTPPDIRCLDHTLQQNLYNYALVAVGLRQEEPTQDGSTLVGKAIAMQHIAVK